MRALSQLSIAAKLYSIFALLVVSTLALVGVLVWQASAQGDLVKRSSAAAEGTASVERINGLIFAIVMESRGIYLTQTWDDKAKKFGANQLKYLDRLSEVISGWSATLSAEDRAEFEAFAGRIKTFSDFRRELVSRAENAGPAAAREFGDNEANRTVRSALNADLEKLGKLYAGRAADVHGRLDGTVGVIASLLSGLALLVVALAALGVFIIRNAVVKPLAEITAVTEKVAAGQDVKVMHGSRPDEIGALARSIEVFQQAMTRNRELTAATQRESEVRAARSAEIEDAVEKFNASVGRVLSAVGDDTSVMRDTARSLNSIASRAATQAGSARTASGDTSQNVNAVAAAAEQLAASIHEITRQVTQAGSIVKNAESTLR